MSIYSILPLLASIIFLICGISIVIRSKEKASLYFFFFSFFVFWWQFCWFFLFNTNDINLANILIKLGYTGIVCLPVFFGNFIISFGANKKYSFIHYIIALLFIFSIWSGNYFVNGYYTYFFGFYPKANWLHGIYLLWLMYLILHPHYYLYVNVYKNPTSTVDIKNRIKFFVIATTFFMLSSTDFLANYGIVFYPIGVIFVLLGLVLYIYGIIKYDLVDINFASKKLLSYFLIVFLLLCFIYFPFGFITNNWSLKVVVIILFLIVFILVMARILHNFFNPTIFKDFETRIKKLETMTTNHFAFKKIETFASHLTINLSEIMNSKEISFFKFNGETGNFDLISKSGMKQRDHNKEISSNSDIVKYLNETKEPLLKIDIKNGDNHKNLKLLLDDLQIEAVYPFFINDDKLMAFLILGDNANNYLYHKQEIKELKDLLKLKEHIFENTYFLEMQTKIRQMTQSIINIDDQLEFNNILSSFICRIFNILNLSLFVYNKEENSFICKYNRGYDKEVFPEIKENSFFIKLLKENEEIIRVDDLQIKANNFFNLKELQNTLHLLEQLRASVVIPLISTNLIGIIILGKKRINDIYYQNDLNFLENIATITAVKIRSFMIQEESEIDHLTKAYNRVSLDVWIHKFISWSKRDQKPLTFLFFDLDKFKNINDKKGHKFGDSVLKEVVSCIKKISRSKDMLFRLGGEEFLYILWNIIDEKDITGVLDRIKIELKKGEYTNSITLSIGQVKYIPNRDFGEKINNTKSIQKTIFRLGDDAVYLAKNTGRNKLCDGGIVEDKLIDENYKLTLQIVANQLNDIDNYKRYFLKNSIETKESNFNDFIEVFNKLRPDGFLLILDEETELEKIKVIISEIKKRSMSSSLGIVLKDYTLKEKLKDYSIDRFFSIDELNLIDDWAKVLAKNLN